MNILYRFIFSTLMTVMMLASLSCAEEGVPDEGTTDEDVAIPYPEEMVIDIDFNKS